MDHYFFSLNGKILSLLSGYQRKKKFQEKTLIANIGN